MLFVIFYHEKLLLILKSFPCIILTSKNFVIFVATFRIAYSWNRICNNMWRQWVDLPFPNIPLIWVVGVSLIEYEIEVFRCSLVTCIRIISTYLFQFNTMCFCIRQHNRKLASKNWFLDSSEGHFIGCVPNYRVNEKDCTLLQRIRPMFKCCETFSVSKFKGAHCIYYIMTFGSQVINNIIYHLRCLSITDKRCFHVAIKAVPAVKDSKIFFIFSSRSFITVKWREKITGSDIIYWMLFIFQMRYR